MNCMFEGPSADHGALGSSWVCLWRGAGHAQPKHSFTCIYLLNNVTSLVFSVSSYVPCEPYVALCHAGLQQGNQSALFNRSESDWICAHTQQPDVLYFMLLCDGPGNPAWCHSQSFNASQTHSIPETGCCASYEIVAQKPVYITSPSTTLFSMTLS